MKIYYQKRFLKDLARIPTKTRNQIEHFVFEEAPSFRSISDSPKIEGMRGYPSYYKVRFGVYRVGLKKQSRD